MPTSGDTLVELIRERVLDVELAALCWLLVEANVPLVVTGDVAGETLGRVASALLHLPPETPAVILDSAQAPLSVDVLADRLRDGDRVALLSRAVDLRALMAMLTSPDIGLPEDAVRRLGLVLVMGLVPSVTAGPVTDRLRVMAAHYLRPLERDGAGHLQRRPPAVLATLDPSEDAFDHFAWGVASELADRVDRSQASFEELQDRRAAALSELAAGVAEAPPLEVVLRMEPPRVPAPPRTAAVPSGLHSPLTDPHPHPH